MLQPPVFAEGEVGAGKCNGAAQPLVTGEVINYMASWLCGPRHAQGKQNVPVL